MATYFGNVTLFDGRNVRTKAGVLTSNGTIEWVGGAAAVARFRPLRRAGPNLFDVKIRAGDSLQIGNLKVSTDPASNLHAVLGIELAK